ncbi:unnamed protein product [Brachionus calyciflorus]|uniref:Cilia- and flagella-associated protein 206 n=1 Tax=Brachionus calyciflorus TaxID=104777 RepID=A0A813MCQ5_9BILA|nr:unnamed protein product [Brachionus calyciflorus]
MSKTQAETVIKNIIREIIQECTTRGQIVSETLVAFIVKAVVLDPDNQFHVDRQLTKDDVQKLIKLCVDHLLDVRSPSLDTIKMQVYFDMNYTTRSEFLEEHRRVLESRLQPVIREITDSRAKTKEDLESLYRKIVSAILLRSGLGSPTDISVVREATAALQSVFPPIELGTFMSMSKRDKERQLVELSLIVTGIRLFNKECGKGGEGIDDLPAILNQAIPATTEEVDKVIDHTVKAANKYTAILENNNSQIFGSYKRKILSDALVNVRQHEICLKTILHDIITCAKNVESLQIQLGQRLDHLKNTIQTKNAIPTSQVYPQFIQLANIWIGFQDELVLISVLSNVLYNLEPFAMNHRQIFNDEFLQPYLTKVQVKTDAQRVKESEKEKINPNDFEDLEWLFPETTLNFEKLTLAFKGFCAHALSRNDFLLLPANPNIGVLQYNNNFYVFSSKKAATEFARNISQHLTQIVNTAKRNPELIQLLEMHNQFKSISQYGDNKLIQKPIIKSDMGTQTDTHILDYNIVKTYEWNEWEMRRKALKMTNLRNKVTHSVQTDTSNFRRENVTQTWLPKEKGAQTKVDNYSNVPQPKVYLTGLRGVDRNIDGSFKPTNMQKIDLTFDVDQK